MICEQFPPKQLILNNRVKGFLGVIVDYITRIGQEQPRSVVEPPLESRINLPRQVPVETSEGQTVVQQHPFIRDIQHRQRHCEPLRERLREGEIERRMRWQIVSRILRVGRAIGES